MLAEGKNIIAKKSIVDHCCSHTADEFRDLSRDIKVQDLCTLSFSMYYLPGMVSLWFLVYLLCSDNFKYCFSMSTQIYSKHVWQTSGRWQLIP